MLFRSAALGEERLLAGREVVDHRRPEAAEIGRLRHRFITRTPVRAADCHLRCWIAGNVHGGDHALDGRPHGFPQAVNVGTAEPGRSLRGRSGWPRTLTTHRGPRQRVIHRQSRKPCWPERAGLTGLGPRRTVVPVDHCRRVAPVRVAPRGVASPAWELGPRHPNLIWEHTGEQAYVPAQQPSSAQDARVPAANAYPGRPVDHLLPPPQGPHAVGRLIRLPGRLRPHRRIH